MDYVDKLKEKIKESKLSITTIAKNSGISRQSIYKVLNKECSCTLKTLECICDAIKIPITQIIENQKDIIDEINEEYIVKNDNMSPMILVGDTIKIKKNEKLFSKDFILIKLKDSEPILKRIKFENDMICLYDDNNLSKDIQTMFFTNEDFEKDVQLIGRVIEVKRNF